MSVLKTRHRRSVYCRVTSSVSWWYREGVVMSLSIESNISVSSITYYLVSTHALWIPTKKSVFTIQNQNILIISQLLSKTYNVILFVPSHEGRSVQFATCVKVYAYLRKFELHRPAFMTLEPIRWRSIFAEKLRNYK